MSEADEKYVLDANVFIQAKRRFYDFDFCPGYWRVLIYYNREGRLYSIDKVHEELKHGRDDLWDWAEQQFGANAFVDTSTAAITSEYRQMLVWVMAQSQFQNTAKTEFQDVADGWLAAYAKQTGCVVVTLEQFDPNVRKRIPLPNVCHAFDVECISPFEMLRRLGVQLNWSPPR